VASPKGSDLGRGSQEGIGLLTCLSLVTATMVGTGVYTSLGFQLVDLQGGFSILLLWALGGLIALCGALSYAELAVAIPRSGGEYTYLSEIYHPSLGFMAAFISVMAGFAAPIALSAIAFGSYLQAAFPGCPAKASSFAAVILISLAHLRSLRLSELVQNGMTSLKFLLLGLFLLIGFWNATKHPSSLSMFLPTGHSLPELLRPSSGIALIFVLYAYSGWNASSYLAGEVRDRQRTVGHSLVLGTALVTLLYVVLNAIFLTAAPAAELRGVLNVGSVAANHLLGPLGGRIMSGMIGLGLLASISAMVWAGPRVTQRVGVDYHFFAGVGRLNAGGIPVRATLLQLLLVLILIATGSFESVLVYAQVPLLLCLVLGVAGVFILRKRSVPTGFRCPFFPLPPLLFIFCTLAALLYSTLSQPWVALAGLGTMILPLLAHPWIASRSKNS
jgi:basic amino acid/polyamine antiporter, APA family